MPTIPPESLPPSATAHPAAPPPAPSESPVPFVAIDRPVPAVPSESLVPFVAIDRPVPAMPGIPADGLMFAPVVADRPTAPPVPVQRPTTLADAPWPATRPEASTVPLTAAPAAPPAAESPAPEIRSWFADVAAVGPAPALPENLDVTIWRPIAATSVMAVGSTVQAVRCVAGHLNPPAAPACRVCAQPVPTQPAIAVPRPPLGALRMSTGDAIPLDHGVLFGRDPGTPDANRRDQPYFVKLADKDISRRHLEVVLDGWDVIALDLNSSNGSAFTPPGGPPELIPGGGRRTLAPGTVVHLSDTISFVFEVRE
jgi:hypothetical protein